MLTFEEKKARAWLRRKGWKTRSGNCLGQAWFIKPDCTVEINPVLFSENIRFQSDVDDYSVYIPMDELAMMLKIAEIAHNNREKRYPRFRIEDYRR